MTLVILAALALLLITAVAQVVHGMRQGRRPALMALALALFLAGAVMAAFALRAATGGALAVPASAGLPVLP